MNPTPGSDGSLHGHLGASLPALPPALATARAREAWRGAALPLPPCLGQLAWECRLSAGEAPIDLQLGLAEDAVRSEILRQSPPTGEPWTLLRTWAAGGFERAVDRMYLELDSPSAAGGPLLFPRIVSTDRFAFALIALELLQQQGAGQVPPGVMATLSRVLQNLPGGAIPRYVCWLGPRGVQQARWIGAVPRKALADFLRQVGWEGDPGGVAAEVDALNPHSSHVPLGLDLTEAGVGPRVGIELFWARAARQDARLEAALDRIGGWPAIHATKIDATRGWARADGVPPALRPDLQLKVSFEGERRSAKAYLGCWTRA